MSRPPAPPPPAATLFYLHIPRSAGTTLIDTIAQNYPRRHVFRLDGALETRQRYVDLPVEAKAQLRLVAGHMTFGLHGCHPAPSTYATMLRHPVARLVSHYRYVRQLPQHYLHPVVTQRQIGLLDFVGQPLVPEVDNGPVRFLAGGALLESLPPGAPFQPVTQAQFDTARRNLETEFSVVGITEHFDESLILMRRSFGWAPPLFLRKNSTSAPDIATEDLAAVTKVVESVHAHALALYAHGLEVFRAQLRRQPASFFLEVRLFKLVNRLYARSHRAGGANRLEQTSLRLGKQYLSRLFAGSRAVR